MGSVGQGYYLLLSKDRDVVLLNCKEITLYSNLMCPLLNFTSSLCTWLILGHFTIHNTYVCKDINIEFFCDNMFISCYRECIFKEIILIYN